MKYRITPRGLLIENNKILFIAYQTPDGVVYALPGGKQKVGENLKSCLIREFKEELNLEVEIGEFILLNEFIHKKSIIPGWEDGIHQVELFFEVKSLQKINLNQLGLQQDKNSIGAKFLSESEMKNYTHYPQQSPNWFFSEKKSIPYLF